jgi:DNA-binding beta-propeller fold protein YncE
LKKLLIFLLLFTSYSVFAGVTFVDSFDVSSEETTPQGVAFNTDGTKMFVVGITDSCLYTKLNSNKPLV